VASLVAEATEVKDENLVIAALLHDAIKDCEVPHELIAKTFGADVADLVAEVRLVCIDRRLDQSWDRHAQGIRDSVAHFPRSSACKRGGAARVTMSACPGLVISTL
jgi:HD domain